MIVNERYRQRNIKDAKNKEVIELLKEELPYIEFSTPKVRVSSKLDDTFAKELIVYADEHNIGSRSELIEMILIDWYKKKEKKEVMK